jgi:protein SMG6
MIVYSQYYEIGLFTPRDLGASRLSRSLQQASTSVSTSSTVQRRRPARPPRAARNITVRAHLELVPGYTILVLDTNILSSLLMVTSLVEGLHWTVVVPLPAIMELDGLASNATALGEATKAAIEFIATRIRSHFEALKVQTSRGNYLSSLSMRAE